MIGIEHIILFAFLITLTGVGIIEKSEHKEVKKPKSTICYMSDYYDFTSFKIGG
jgi:hypothetical protein